MCGGSGSFAMIAGEPLSLGSEQRKHNELWLAPVVFFVVCALFFLLDGSWESWYAFRPYGAGWLASRPVHHAMSEPLND